MDPIRCGAGSVGLGRERGDGLVARRLPFPLIGKGGGGGERHRAFGLWRAPTLTFPHKGGGNPQRFTPCANRFWSWPFLALLLGASAASAQVYRRGEPGEPETLDPQKTQTVVEATRRTLARTRRSRVEHRHHRRARLAIARLQAAAEKSRRLTASENCHGICASATAAR